MRSSFLGASASSLETATRFREAPALAALHSLADAIAVTILQR
jgi:hypothetical protein